MWRLQIAFVQTTAQNKDSSFMIINNREKQHVQEANPAVLLNFLF